MGIIKVGNIVRQTKDGIFKVEVRRGNKKKGTSMIVAKEKSCDKCIYYIEGRSHCYYPEKFNLSSRHYVELPCLPIQYKLVKSNYNLGQTEGIIILKHGMYDETEKNQESR